MMITFPNIPFLTKKFSPPGGGIDFLGTRAVNLNILSEWLLPGINNATRDIGIYCLGTWLPWKFHQLSGKTEFTVWNYQKFQEAIEIAISHAVRDDSPANQQYGSPRRRMGVEQKIKFDSSFTFKNMGRTPATSIYAAPLYGPSLRYLDLIGYAVAADGRQTKILMPSEAEGTEVIARYVDQALRRSKSYSCIDRIDISKMDAEDIDNLALHGLHPVFFTENDHEALKRAFMPKLLPLQPNMSGYGRTMTAKLLIDTVKHDESVYLDDLRSIWHTGLIAPGKRLNCRDAEIEEHRKRWAVFQARQIQRLILEVFLRCFELGLDAGCRSIDHLVTHAIENWGASADLTIPGTFESLILKEAEAIDNGHDFFEISRHWNEGVDGQHLSYEEMEEGEPQEEYSRACQMLARWYLRVYAWVISEDSYQFLEQGGKDRLSIAYLHEWVGAKKFLPFKTFLSDLFLQLVFAQHLRVALARFDGEMQRLRFILGDNGIVPTDSARSRFGESPSVMEDRLDAFIALLEDLEIVESNDDGEIFLGKHHDYLG